MDYREMLQVIDDEGVGVTDWEAEFLDSLMKQDFPFTEKQKSTLKKIYAQRVEDIDSE